MQRRAQRWGVAVLFLAGAASAGGGPAPVPQADCAEQVARQVQSRYESVRDLSARFTQTSRVVSLGGSGGGVGTMRGEVVFAKPGRMRWSYQEPEPSLVVSDGETLWLYDPALQEVQRLAVGQGFLSGAAIQFLLGQGEILKAFRVRSDACEGQRVHLVLLPREDATYERLEILADRETGEIVETTVVDLFGNVTQVRFEDVRVNQSPPDQTFRFVAPPGARVLELPARPADAQP